MYIKELCTSETGKLKDKIPKPFILFSYSFLGLQFYHGSSNRSQAYRIYLTVK